jgi:hypothetical protein
LIGRRNHALRQQRYRERQRKKVTHQGRSEQAGEAKVRALPAADAMAARPTGTEVPAHDPQHVRHFRRPVVCAWCGQAGRYLRHETLARAGRPEQQRPFRSRVEGS